MAAVITGIIGRTIHDTVSALIDRQATSKAATAINSIVTNAVTTTLGVAEDLLKTVQDLTESDPAPPPPKV
jgi:hypothetical protein